MRSWVTSRYALLLHGVACAIVVSGCGGGGSEEAAPAPAPAADSGKPATPTVKGLGASAKERQSEIDGGGQAAAEPKKEMSDLEKAQAAMRAQQGGAAGPPGGGQPAGGGPTPGVIAPPGSGGGGPPGISFGGQPGGQPGGMPGGGVTPGGGFGGAGNNVLMADTAFLENGEALAPPGAGGVQGQGPGAPGAAGSQAADDFSEPTKAVESFLSAVQSKDGERIAKAVSRRGAEEAKTPAVKKVMEGAVKKSLKDADIDSLAQAFAEYKVVNVSLTKTSGSVNVTIGREVKSTSKKKSVVPDYERRILRVHRDGSQGWKVVDFGNRITQ
ncbi:MAG: hypothetical protein ACKO5E_09060 [bacterium]